MKLLPLIEIFIYKNLYTRKIYHFVGGGVIILGLIHLDRFWFILLGCAYFVAFWAITKRFTLSILSILILLVVSNSSFSTLAGTAIWVVGDGLSALVGSTLGLKKWSWNEKKSVVGSFAFVAGGTCSTVILLMAHNVNPPHILWLLALVPALVGSIFEATLDPKIAGVNIGDNTPVIIAGGFAFHLLSILLGVMP